MLERINKWYDRFENLRQIKKDCQLETIQTQLTEYDLKDILDILGTFRQVIENAPTNL